MSKIICDVCGTSYPDTATQCPICGSVRPVESANLSQSDSGTERGGYTYVKGGRFSKSNVKKRNKASQNHAYHADANEDGDRKNVGLIILLIVLLTIIALLVVFVVIASLGYNPNGSVQSPGNSQTNDSGEISVPCLSVTSSYDQVTLEEVGATFTLRVATAPLNTTDTISYASSDESVVTVDSNGVITCIAEGQATITITCGEAQTQCQVICSAVHTTVAPEDFRLSRTAISFEMEGFSWILYSGEIPMEQITWSSDDESVATVVDGVVTAVGEGETTVYGEYGGNKVGCKIVCKFLEEENGNNGEEEGNSGGNTGTSEQGELHVYAKYFFNPNNYGDFSISISKDDTLTLMLCDKNKNEVEAAWSIDSQPYASLSGSKVKGLIPGGIAVVTATYNGQTYTCKIRISK